MIEHTLGFNGDLITAKFDFRGQEVHISVESKTLGTIEDSTASAKDYAYILNASSKEIEQYIISQLAFRAYFLAEKIIEGE